jgi:pimeloyl-ACP methyl ester carboxylesterase
MGVLRQSLRPPLGVAVRVALVVVLGLLVALVIDIGRSGGPDAWLARRGISPPYLPQGRMVDIGGRALYLDCRGTGSPTIVLESGMGVGASGWSPVFDALAGTNRTCAYDRAGRGPSESRGRHTLEDAADDLRALLAAADERPPFVVVGHSLGGDYARIFASRSRDRVSGLVLVDSFSPDLQSGAIHPLLGPLQAEYDVQLQALRDLVERVEDLDWTASEAQLQRSDLTGLRIEVLRAPRAEPRLDAATNATIATAWEAAYGALAPGTVRYEIAWGAGHIIQADRPDLVIAAIRRVATR